MPMVISVAQADRGCERAAHERTERRRCDGQEAHRRGHPAEQPIGGDRLPQRQVVDAPEHAAEVERQHRKPERNGRDHTGPPMRPYASSRRPSTAGRAGSPADAVALRQPFRRCGGQHAAEPAEHEASRSLPPTTQVARREQHEHGDLHVMQHLPQAGDPGERGQRAVVRGRASSPRRSRSPPTRADRDAERRVRVAPPAASAPTRRTRARRAGSRTAR